MPTTTEPTVKTDRPRLLASALIKELAQSRITQIRRAPVVVPDPPKFKPTAAMRAVQRLYEQERRRHTREKQRLQAKIKALGATIASFSPYALSGPAPVGTSQEIKRAQQTKLREDRINRVQLARTSALIELISVGPAGIKAFVTKYQQALEKL